MIFLEFILHFDKHITNIINNYGMLTYFLLFFVIFAETGFVVAPFLPGDSLLFAVGTLAARNILNIWSVYFLFLGAAILGDTVNYSIGKRLGPRVFSKPNSRIFKKSHLAKTEAFYEKYGGKTIILARFIPIIRTFAPFVAGVGQMHYRTFLYYNVIGAFLWVTMFTWLGYLFGGIKIIKDNFELAVVGVIIFSVIPIAFEYIMHKKRAKLKKANYKNLKKTIEKEN